MNDKSLEFKSDNEFIEDPRYKQCNREAIYGVVLGLLNLAWWYIFGYGLGSQPVEEYTYILGFPAWFFMSSLVGAIIFTILTFVMVNRLFKDMPLDEMTEEEAMEYIQNNNKGVE